MENRTEWNGMGATGRDGTGGEGGPLTGAGTKGTKLTAPQVARQGCAILIPTYHFQASVWKLRDSLSESMGTIPVRLRGL